MIVKKVTVESVLATNAYFYVDEKTKHGFLIDPAAEPETLMEIIKDNGWIIEKMLITHGHFDHLGAVQKLNETLGIPYYAHQKAKDYLLNERLNLSGFLGAHIYLDKASYLRDGEELFLDANDSVKLKVIHVPGHTEDGVIFYDEKEKIAFVGDTVFKGAIGRTDCPGGDFNQLKQSILQKVWNLPEETVLYPGHSEATTVGAEKINLARLFDLKESL